jgi:hypothetical protein
MKNLIRSTVPSLLLVLASAAFAAVPPMNVTVSDAGGKAAFRGSTDAKGNFTTSTLKAGNYVVQFNATKADLKGNRYTIVVSAGKKKVSANAVPGEKFTRGGVAMKVEVGTGLNITGQVAAETGPVSKSGKKMVWIPPQLGSNFPGHWVEEGSPEAIAAKTAGSMSSQDLQKRQDQGVTMPGN